MDYYSFIEQNKDRVIFQYREVICNKTLRKSYFVRSNVFCDGTEWYIGKDINSVQHSRKELRKKINRLLSACGCKPKLSGVDNDTFYTRLIYEFKGKPLVK